MAGPPSPFPLRYLDEAIGFPIGKLRLFLVPRSHVSLPGPRPRPAFWSFVPLFLRSLFTDLSHHQYAHQKDALQIVNLPAHVAVSLTRQYYIPLVNVNWAGCYRKTIVMCKDLPYMKKVTDRTCIALLL